MQDTQGENAPASNQVVACLGGDETALEKRAAPRAGPGEMVLRLRVSGFCGTDLFKLKTGSAAPGSVLGHEIVGDVIELGAGIDAFEIGDRVVVPHHVPCGTCLYCARGNETMCEVFKENLMEPGGFADLVLIRPRATQHAAYKVPDGLSDEAAVFVEPAACVLRGIDRSGLGTGGTAAVLGCGSMGLLHLLVLKAAVPKVSVVMVDPDQDRLAIAARLGAERTAAPGDEAHQAAHELSDGHGADAVFDTVGGPKTLDAGLRLTRQGGSVVLFAHAPDGAHADFDLNTLFKHERRIIGSYSGALGEQKRIFDMIRDGQLDPSPLVTHTMPLDDFAHGVSLVVEQKALKVLFTPSRSAGARP